MKNKNTAQCCPAVLCVIFISVFGYADGREEQKGHDGVSTYSARGSSASGNIRLQCIGSQCTVSLYNNGDEKIFWSHSFSTDLPLRAQPVIRTVSLVSESDAVHLRLPLEGTGFWEAVVHLKQPEPVIVWSGRTGLHGTQSELKGTGLVVKDLTGNGLTDIVRGQLNREIYVCSMEQALLFPEGYDPARGKFFPVDLNRLHSSELSPENVKAVIKKPFDFRRPLTVFGNLMPASSQPGAGSSSLALDPPAAVVDSDASTWWVEGRPGWGREEFITFKRVQPGYPVKAIALIASPDIRKREARKLGRLRTLEIVTAESRYAAEFEDDPARHPGEAYWIVFPSAVNTDCISLVIKDVFEGTASPAQTAIAEVAVYSPLDFSEKPLQILFDDLNNPQKIQRASAVLRSVAGRMKDDLLEALPSLEGAAYREVLKALAGIIPERVIVHLADCLGSEDQALRFVCRRALAEAGDEAVPVLADRLQSEDSEHIGIVSSVLSETGTVRAAAVLLDALMESPDNIDRLMVLRDSLRHCFSRMNAGDIKSLVSQTDRSGRWIYVMESMPENIPELKSMMEKEIRDAFSSVDDFNSRYRLVRLASKYTSEHGVCCSRELTELSRSDDNVLRASAVMAMGAGPESLGSSDLERLLGDKDPGVRDAALLVASMKKDCGGNYSITIIDSTVETDPWPFVRERALRALGRCLGQQSVDRAVLSLDDRSARIRATALDIISSWPEDRLMEHVIGPLSNSREKPYIRAKAAAILGKNCFFGAVDPLVELLYESFHSRSSRDLADAAVAAVRALAMLGTPKALDAVELAVRRGPHAVQKEALAVSGRKAYCSDR